MVNFKDLRGHVDMFIREPAKPSLHVHDTFCKALAEFFVSVQTASLAQPPLFSAQDRGNGDRESSKTHDVTPSPRYRFGHWHRVAFGPTYTHLAKE